MKLATFANRRTYPMTVKPMNLQELKTRAGEVAGLLKTLSHPNRLLIACQLMEGEYTVGEIEALTGVGQPVLSRELARLRRDGLLATRRESRMIHYRLADDRLASLVNALCNAFAPIAKRGKIQPAPRRRPGRAQPSRRKK